eukprot:TRINITY_DN21435_c0_g1_i1.p1 TRINITY_DN21435_c0_g1~~TRINITY_DN21435_c0_g1_i1.p1  ORF type:complete len:268 (+),score=62.87 TRINITY_DN21435_c0_g1_i1:43-846(+)
MEDNQLTIYPNLKNKNVLITGASAGIGKASALHFAACGSNLILLARRLEKLEALKQEILQKYGVTVFIYKIDVAVHSEWPALMKAIPSELERIDILVNNAGKALGFAHLTDYPHEDVNEILDVNIKGAIYAIQFVVKGMKERKTGHIINLSSIAGKQAYVNGSIYCASKYALEAVSDSLRQELVDTGIRVTKISPGAVNTEFSVVRFRGDNERANKVYEGFVPLVAEDIADNILYAASRPQHVQIADIIVFPNAQASAYLIHRKPNQ